MKHLLPILFLFTGLTLSFGQTTTFTEDFKSNKSGWLEINSPEGTLAVTNAKLAVNRTSPQGTWHTGIHKLIDTEQDFTIKTTLTIIQGTNKKGYGSGLAWGMENEFNLNAFVINGGQRFAVYQFQNGEYNEHKGWSKSEIIKPNGQPNELRISKQGKYLVFYINGEQVFSMDFIPFQGPSIGYAFLQNTKVEVDQLTVISAEQKIHEIKHDGKSFSKENLGPSINSAFHEFSPAVSPDGKMLYFSRYNHPDNTGTEKTDDIWKSERLSDNKWSEAVNIGQPLNNEVENSVLSTMPDGNTLLIIGKYSKSGAYAGVGLSTSDMTEEGWSNPTALEIEDFESSGATLSACLSFDNKILIISKKGKTTQGSTDLYVSFLQDDGTWSSPKNLGSTVNSRFRDETPFLAADDRSLYFSSNGRPGYGNGDIFVTRRMDDTWENWTEPENLGPNVNSAEWDAYYSMTAKGDIAYVVSRKDAIGESDIFKVRLEEGAKPGPVALIKGTVYNAKTKEPIQAKITYHEMNSDEELGIAHSHHSSGKYEIILPYGKDYSFFADKEGFYSVREHIDETGLEEYQEIEVDLYLEPLEIGNTIQIKNVFFERGKAILLEQSYAELDKLVEMLTASPNLEIAIEGHTDNQGSAKQNLLLSENRVETVKKYLIEKGINKKRISGQGYGGSKPIADNRFETSRKLNRRVEFKITKI